MINIKTFHNNNLIMLNIVLRLGRVEEERGEGQGGPDRKIARGTEFLNAPLLSRNNEL